MGKRFDFGAMRGTLQTVCGRKFHVFPDPCCKTSPDCSKGARVNAIPTGIGAAISLSQKNAVKFQNQLQTNAFANAPPGEE